MRTLFQLFGNKANGRISKRVFEGKKARQIFRKTKSTCTYQGVRNVRFSGNSASFVFLETPVRYRYLPHLLPILHLFLEGIEM